MLGLLDDAISRTRCWKGSLAKNQSDFSYCLICLSAWAAWQPLAMVVNCACQCIEKIDVHSLLGWMLFFLGFATDLSLVFSDNTLAVLLALCLLE
jgi:hypothetical protein